MRIALIGNGKMGSALLTQWLKADGGGARSHTFLVVDPAMASDPVSASDNDRVTYVDAPPSERGVGFDLLIVAVKPQIVDAVLPQYASLLAEDGFVASIAAGCSIERLRALVGGAPVVRVMPNLPAAIGEGVSGLCADPSTNALQRDAIQDLMAAAGKTLWVEDEDKLDRLTAIAGSGPGYVFEIARVYVEAAEAMGFSSYEARRMVFGTMAGTLAMAQDSDQSLEELRNSVTSKNGTTAAGLDALNGDGGLSDRMRATIDAAYARAVELR